MGSICDENYIVESADQRMSRACTEQVLESHAGWILIFVCSKTREATIVERVLWIVVIGGDARTSFGRLL